jgi:hypothetical protein
VKHLKFRKKENADEWLVLTKKDELLGQIYYHKPWKEYIFEPLSDTIFSAGCMGELIAFMEGIK